MNCNDKNNRAVPRFYTTLVIALLLISITDKSEASVKKKKIFIGTIKAKNVPSKMSEITTNVITSSILENYSERYNVISLDDVREVLRKEEIQQLLAAAMRTVCRK